MEIRKRVQLSLKPELDFVITDLAILTKQTKTSVITGILMDMLPMLKQTAMAIEKVQKGKNEIAITLMKDLVDETEQKFKSAQIELNDMGAINGNK
jgi:hypothetical protein